MVNNISNVDQMWNDSVLVVCCGNFSNWSETVEWIILSRSEMNEEVTHTVPLDWPSVDVTL